MYFTLNKKTLWFSITRIFFYRVASSWPIFSNLFSKNGCCSLVLGFFFQEQACLQNLLTIYWDVLLIDFNFKFIKVYQFIKANLRRKCNKSVLLLVGIESNLQPSIYSNHKFEMAKSIKWKTILSVNLLNFINIL